MHTKIKNTLLHLAQKIVNQPDAITSEKTYEHIRTLYELVVVMRHLEAQEDLEETHWKLHEKQLDNILKDLVEIKTAAAMSSSKNKTESSSLEIPPPVDSVNDIVTEIPEEKTMKSILAQVEEPPDFEKKEDSQQRFQQTPQKSVNDRFSKEMKIDINDRLAFIKELFRGDTQAYQKAISQIASMTLWEEVDYFIKEVLKPDYNFWEGKESYEKRFMKILEKSFKQDL